METFPQEYILIVDVKNDTDTMKIVTTEDFKIRQKEGEKFLSPDEVRAIFPVDPLTRDYIDFVRLRPRIGDSIPGEQLKLTAEFSVHTAKDNSMYNVVSKCAYGNTLDAEKIKNTWDEYENKLRADETSTEDIEFQKRNFYMLDAQRHFKENSYDFVLQTVGVYDNVEIVKKACAVLQNKLVELVQSIDSDIVPILNSETTIDNCYDIILENEDYTIGKVLEYILYEKYYVNEKIIFQEAIFIRKMSLIPHVFSQENGEFI
jgi:DNA-directed RNA polymerase subunit L